MVAPEEPRRVPEAVVAVAADSAPTGRTVEVASVAMGAVPTLVWEVSMILSCPVRAPLVAVAVVADTTTWEAVEGLAAVVAERVPADIQTEQSVALVRVVREQSLAKGATPRVLVDWGRGGVEFTTSKAV